MDVGLHVGDAFQVLYCFSCFYTALGLGGCTCIKMCFISYLLLCGASHGKMDIKLE